MSGLVVGVGLAVTLGVVLAASCSVRYRTEIDVCAWADRACQERAAERGRAWRVPRDPPHERRPAP